MSSNLLPPRAIARWVSCGKRHMPSLLVVNRWAADGESGSHYDFWCRHDVWMMIFYQFSERITSIISIARYFTTKSDGIWVFSLSSKATNKVSPVVLACGLWVARVVMGLLLYGD